MASSRILAALAVGVLPLTSVLAQTTDVAELQRRLEEQEKKTTVLERKLEIQDENAKAALPNTPIIKAGPKGFSISSQDGANVIKFRGLVHFDGRYYLDDAGIGGKDGWRTSRIRPTLEGTFYNFVDWRITPDFAQGRSVIQDAYVTGRFNPAAQVTAGKFKSPVSLERLQAGSDIRFQDRGYTSLLAPNRDLGIQVAGNVLKDRLSYQVAYLNGSNDGGSSEAFSDADVNNDKEWAARLWTQPFAASDNFYLRGLGFGIAGTVTDQTGSNSQTLLGSVRTPGGQTFFSYRGSAAASGSTPATNATIQDGDRVRISPQLYWSAGSFGVLADYVKVKSDVSRQATADDPVLTDTLDTSAWQVQLAWFATGEEESYKGFVPNSTFNVGKEGWGALEFVARYQEFEADKDAFTGGAQSFANPNSASREAKSIGVGANWYLNQNIKLALEYENTSFKGGAAGGADRDDENAILTRVQLNF